MVQERATSLPIAAVTLPIGSEKLGTSANQKKLRVILLIKFGDSENSYTSNAIPYKILIDRIFSSKILKGRNKRGRNIVDIYV